MKKICISRDWNFLKYGDKDWQKVDLPHDYAITEKRDPQLYGGAQGAYIPLKAGIYKKYFTGPASEDATHTILDIDGAYMCTTVTLNGDRLIMHPHGYAPLLVDLTEKLRPGRTNKLEIGTNPPAFSTRWYSGAGLYRDVFLWTGGCVRLEPWDTFVSTESASEEEAILSLQYAVSSDISGAILLKIKVLSPAGEVVATENYPVAVAAGEKTSFATKLAVKSPALWSRENPQLSTLVSEIYLDGMLTDSDETTFGIRTLAWNAQEGLLLNGKSIKLRGGCIHHDHGVLGAASFPAAEERKVRLLKEAGFNALRIAHNPPSLALLEVCDREGILVMDEAFDMWNVRKTPGDYALWFRDWWKRDIDAMVLRDRNHPSVVSFSIGNEILERDCSSDGAAWAKLLADEIRSLDTTHAVTSGICGMWDRPDPMDPEDYAAESDKRSLDWADRIKGYTDPLDIVGYNYYYGRYESDHERFPERVIWGSETHTLRFYDSWNIIRRVPYVLGDFTWTAIDNLGEVGAGRSMWAREGYLPGIVLQPYPWRTCFQGDLDLAGFPRPQASFRRSVWIGDVISMFTVHPEHRGEGFSGTGWHFYDVWESWTFEEQYIGAPVPVQVYTDCDKVTFRLNGRPVGDAIPEKNIAHIEIPYEPGKLTAYGWKNGKPAGHCSLETVGAPARILVESEKKSFAADRRDLCWFDITVTDKEGRKIGTAGNELTCYVQGGELMGIFSGEPANEDQYGSPKAHAFAGRAVAVVRTSTPGEVTVLVTGEGLASGCVSATAE